MKATQKAGCGFGHADFVGGVGEYCCEVSDGWATFNTKDTFSGDDLVGYSAEWLLEDGIEAAGGELDSEDVGLVFEEAGEFAGLDAVDFGGVALEDKVNAGMREGLRVGGWKAAHVPGDDPVVLDERCEVGRCEMAGVVDAFGGSGPLEEAARHVDVGKRLSRFSNHAYVWAIMLVCEVML